MRLPGRYGGLTLRLGSPEEAAAAYWASWTTHSADMPQLMHQLGWASTADPEWGHAMEAMATLRSCGVDVSEAAVALTPEAAADYSAGPWAADTPIE